MDKETYQALKRIIKACKWYNEISEDYRLKNKDIKQVETWIDEVANEYD